MGLHSEFEGNLGYRVRPVSTLCRGGEKGKEEGREGRRTRRKERRRGRGIQEGGTQICEIGLVCSMA